MIPNQSNPSDGRFFLSSYDYRLATFRNWPYDGKCSAANLAKSGFYHPKDSNSDVAKCFVCSKELEGWEPDDDPHNEHKKHSPSCPYLSSKAYEQLTFKEGLEMDVVRYTLYLKKLQSEIIDNAIAHVNEKFNLLSKFLVSQIPKRGQRAPRSSNQKRSVSQASSMSSTIVDNTRPSRRTRAKRL